MVAIDISLMMVMMRRRRMRRQKSIKNILKGSAIKEIMDRLISKFFIYESVMRHKIDSHHFKNMIVGAQQAGM